MIFFNVLNKALHLLNVFKDYSLSLLGSPQPQPLKVKIQERRPSGVSKKIWLLFITLFFFLQVNDATAQVKYKYGLSIGTGLYAAEGFGTNLSGAIRFNKYFDAGRHFVEGSVGLASIRSQVLNAIGNTQFFEHNSLISFEFLYGYDPRMWTSLPYFTAGVASINQGGQSHFAGIIGVGNRIYFDKLFGSDKMGLRYDLRDHIFKQSYNSSGSFVTHNLNLTLNLEFFF